MKKHIRKILLIGVALAIVSYTLKDISLLDVLQKVGQADLTSLIWVAAITLFSYVLRAERWRQALKTLGYHPSLFRTTIAILSGIVASIIIPASGELTRCVSLQRTDNVPVSHGMGSVIAERVLDVIVLIMMILLTIAVEFGRMKLFMSTYINIKVDWQIVILLFFAAIVFLSILLKVGINHINNKNIIWVKRPIISRLVGVSKGLWTGFSAMRNLSNPLIFITLTILNQVLSCLVVFILLNSLDISRHLPASTTLTIISAASIGGFAVPTQGGIGIYHFLVSRVLVLYNLELRDGVIIATFLHTVQFLVGLLLSGFSLFILPVIISNPSSTSKDVS